MRHDPFDFNITDMTWGEKAVRILLLLATIGVLFCDLFIWRP